MEKLALKGKQFAGFCLLILFSILINYGGSLFAAAQKLPLWLDAAGTAMAAYLGGPVCGAIVGLTSNLVNYLMFGDPWFYCIVSITVAAVIVDDPARLKMGIDRERAEIFEAAFL